MSVVAAVAPLEWGDVLVRLGVDLVAVAVLAYGVYFRRHGRRDCSSSMRCSTWAYSSRSW